jgi:hypothetical protein
VNLIQIYNSQVHEVLAVIKEQDEQTRIAKAEADAIRLQAQADSATLQHSIEELSRQLRECEVLHAQAMTHHELDRLYYRLFASGKMIESCRWRHSCAKPVPAATRCDLLLFDDAWLCLQLNTHFAAGYGKHPIAAT